MCATELPKYISGMNTHSETQATSTTSSRVQLRGFETGPSEYSRRKKIVAATLLTLVAATGIAYAGKTYAESASSVGIPSIVANRYVYGGGGYVNGQIPSDQLVSIEGGFLMIDFAAKHFDEMVTALRAQGLNATVNSAYRTLEDQQDMIDRFGLLEDGGAAAPLGKSEHGMGTTVDLTLDGEALDWMRENAERFGFFETVPAEPWHWSYTG